MFPLYEDSKGLVYTFDQLAAEIDLKLPPVIIDPKAIEHQLLTAATRTFLEAVMGETFKPFEDFITPYFYEQYPQTPRRRGNDAGPVVWHHDPVDLETQTYFHQFRATGNLLSGRRPGSYLQGLSLGLQPYDNDSKSHLSYLFVGLTADGKIKDIAINPTNDPDGKIKNTPYGISRIDTTPHLKSVLDALGTPSPSIYINLKDRRNIKMGLGKHTFTLSGDGFVLSEPKQDPDNLTKKLNDTLTANGFSALIREIMSLIPLYDPREVAARQIEHNTRQFLEGSK